MATNQHPADTRIAHSASDAPTSLSPSVSVPTHGERGGITYGISEDVLAGASRYDDGNFRQDGTRVSSEDVSTSEVRARYDLGTVSEDVRGYGRALQAPESRSVQTRTVEAYSRGEETRYAEAGSFVVATNTVRGANPPAPASGEYVFASMYAYVYAMADFRLSLYESYGSYGAVEYVVTLEDDQYGVIFCESCASFDDATLLCELLATLFDLVEVER